MSLQWKLVLSYLGVALGAILVLGFVSSQAVQVYLARSQEQELHTLAKFLQKNLINPAAPNGQLNQPDLTSIFNHGGPGPIMLVINTADGQTVCGVPPDIIDSRNCNSPTVQQALNQAAQQQQPVEGTMNVLAPSGATFPAQYLAESLYSQGRFIGTMFVLQPPGDTSLLTTIDKNIFLAGILIALVVGLFSLALAHRFTRPIMRLTRAAERLKRGQYAERVPASTSQDELGMLAQTFNEMATQIEADVNELRNQEQVRRELIANIAHDLATPLTAIQGFSEAMADNMLPDPQAQQETAQRIGREVQRLRRLVADMQNMTAIESGRLRLDLAPLDMHSLIDETLAVIAPECENKGITLLNQTNRNTPTVMADSDRITQVLLNLLDNARRHTPSEGIITVNAATRGQELCVWVSDTGQGIDAKDVPHIFERFYRADRSRAASTGGSGLGLAIVKAIITAHGGKIWAQSAPGKGTTIAFTLLLIKTPDKATHPLPKLGLQKSRS
jgi:signal transduction histidine kinase